MLEIIKKFLRQNPKIPQAGSLRGKYYERTGACTQCGQCCSNIYLVHGEQTINSLPLFEELQATTPDYASFVPIDADSEGNLLFCCTHLQVDKRCGIYDTRPDFCRRYPSEQGMLMGAKLAADCGYQFRLLKSFQTVLETGLGRN
jgi:Fe-S-cluster containining protein